MHPLSVEDVLHLGGHTLSKADYYPKHLFIRVLCHTLGSASCTSPGFMTAAGSSPPFTDIPRSASPPHFEFDEKRGLADEGVYEHNADPMADEFKIGRVPSVDPEMGPRRTSLLVRGLYFIAI